MRAIEKRTSKEGTANVNVQANVKLSSFKGIDGQVDKPMIVALSGLGTANSRCYRRKEPTVGHFEAAPERRPQ